MAKRVGIFIDISNLYFCVHHKYKRKLDYEKLYDYLNDLGSISVARAYGAQVKNEAHQFLYRLKEIGFEPIYKSPKAFNNATHLKRKADWDVGIVVDIYRNIDQLDLIIIGTADSDFAPLIEDLINKGKQVFIIGCNISSDIKKLTPNCVEIPRSFLEDL